MLQARGEFTNGFNLVNLSNPNGALNRRPSARSSPPDMRQVQVGLRLTF